MAGSKIIKQLLTERNVSVNDLAEKLGIKAQSMSNKLYRNNFSFEEVCKICDILNCDIKAITRDTHKEFYELLSYSSPISTPALKSNHASISEEQPTEAFEEKLERLKREHIPCEE